MKITVKEEWNDKSKLAIIAMMGSIIAIIAIIVLD